VLALNMTSIGDYINSGILEMYVLGDTNADETSQVELMATEYAEVRDEINAISDALEAYATMYPIAPDPIIKPFLAATVDYAERLKSGEQPIAPPILHPDAQIHDYAEWLNRADMKLPAHFTDVHAKIIGYTPEAITAIVWIKEMSPQEVHDVQHEKFLIVEGTCTITIEDHGAHQLVPGSVLSIPLHKNHTIVVTSDIPCKVILQRIAIAA
jgi:mannose-6-phosphate isomerase-like protein (cupin superfamily)